MFRTRVFILFLVASSLFVGFVAEAKAACSGASCNDKITRLYLQSDGNRVYIGFASDERNLYCKPTSDVYVILPTNAPLFKETYASLLAAFLANRSVNVRVNTDGAECHVLYVTLDN